MTKYILVTGGAGFIGSNLVDELVKTKQPVVVLDNLDKYYDSNRKRRNLESALKTDYIKLVEGDIRDKELLGDVFCKFKINQVVHLAALAGVRPSLSDPVKYMEVNVTGTINLLEESRKNKVKQFIFASSSSVYGTRLKGPFTESDRPSELTSPYAVTKKAAEMMCQVYADTYKLPTTVVRIFNAYGPRNRPDMACYKFMAAMAANQPIEVYGDGELRRDFTYVGDIVRGFIKVMEKPKTFDVVNLGSARPTSINTLIQTIEKVTRRQTNIKYLAKNNSDVPLTFADINHAKNEYGWEPQVNLLVGLARMWDWYKKEGGVKL